MNPLVIIRKNSSNLFFLEFPKIEFPAKSLSFGAKMSTGPRNVRGLHLPSAEAPSMVTWQKVPTLATRQGILSLGRRKKLWHSSGMSSSERSRQVSLLPLGWLTVDQRISIFIRDRICTEHHPPQKGRLTWVPHPLSSSNLFYFNLPSRETETSGLGYKPGGTWGICFSNISASPRSRKPISAP